MSEPERPPEPGAETESAPAPQPGFVERYGLLQASGGVATALITALLAFLIGGLVVLATGHNPLSAYKQIFNGTGLNWLFPWVTGTDRTFAALNLQQTLIKATPLILTGLAVAFAFRCGMFNIGGQGQYTAGTIVAVWVGSSWAGLAGPVHIVLAIVLASLAGAAFAGIAGLLKATVGAHEVISTIMLNWIAYYTGSYLFGLGGPLQGHQKDVPISNDIATNTHLHVFWGDPILQGLHVGFFVAIGALVAYWVILNRTTLGYEVRAVGFNAEAARYGGINVARNYVAAMAISGLFAGLAGAVDILGWQFRLGQLDVQASNIGFTGIAVALLGRNTAVGVFFSALLFGGLINGTSGRHLSADVFPPQLAGNLTLIIQGLVVLFIGADVLVLYVWQRLRKARPSRTAPAVTET
jgi:simple sugar transport system permease protein